MRKLTSLKQDLEWTTFDNKKTDDDTDLCWEFLERCSPKGKFFTASSFVDYNDWAVVAVAHIRVSYLINSIKIPTKVGIMITIITTIIMLWFWFWLVLSHFWDPTGASNTEDAEWKHYSVWDTFQKVTKPHYHDCAISCNIGAHKSQEWWEKGKRKRKKERSGRRPSGPVGHHTERQVANELLGWPTNRVQRHQPPLLKGATTDFRNIHKTKNKLLKETCISVCKW